jgi:hypothetical protein
MTERIFAVPLIFKTSSIHRYPSDNYRTVLAIRPITRDCKKTLECSHHSTLYLK